MIKMKYVDRESLYTTCNNHNNFSQKNNLISWGSPTNTKAKYMELVVELGNDTLRISNAE